VVKLALLSLGVSLLCLGQTAEEYKSSVSAEHWMSMCRPILDAKIQHGGRPQVTDGFDAGQCAGSFETLSILTSLFDGAKPVLNICAPPDHTLTQWVAIFAEYTKRNPKRYREAFAIVAIAALQEAYPCHK
jgi:hypothetical protein